MASKKSEWKITKISNSAWKNIEALDSNSQKVLIKNLDALQNDPLLPFIIVENILQPIVQGTQSRFQNLVIRMIRFGSDKSQ